MIVSSPFEKLCFELSELGMWDSGRHPALARAVSDLWDEVQEIREQRDEAVRAAVILERHVDELRALLAFVRLRAHQLLESTHV